MTIHKHTTTPVNTSWMNDVIAAATLLAEVASRCPSGQTITVSDANRAVATIERARQTLLLMLELNGLAAVPLCNRPEVS